MLCHWKTPDLYSMDDFGRASMPEALQRLTFVLSENLETRELGIIAPNKCGDVENVEHGHHTVSMYLSNECQNTINMVLGTIQPTRKNTNFTLCSQPACPPRRVHCSS